MTLSLGSWCSTNWATIALNNDSRSSEASESHCKFKSKIPIIKITARFSPSFELFYYLCGEYGISLPFRRERRVQTRGDLIGNTVRIRDSTRCCMSCKGRPKQPLELHALRRLGNDRDESEDLPYTFVWMMPAGLWAHSQDCHRQSLIHGRLSSPCEGTADTPSALVMKTGADFFLRCGALTVFSN